jgi:hypothetical protein
MCSPSQTMQNINQQVQTFSQKVTNQAGTVFANANSVFNNIMGTVKGIVAGGPSQTGFSATEDATRQAANVENAGMMARNEKAAAGSAVAAIGGGNAVTPSGTTAAAVTNAQTTAAATQAKGENEIESENWETGRQNFAKALGAEQSAPSVFGVANEFNNEAGSEQQTAEKSQQNIDTQKSWGKSLLLKTGTSLLQGPQMPSMGGGGMPGGQSKSSADQGLDQGADSADSGADDTVGSDSGSMSAGDMGSDMAAAA